MSPEDIAYAVEHGPWAGTTYGAMVEAIAADLREARRERDEARADLAEARGELEAHSADGLAEMRQVCRDYQARTEAAELARAAAHETVADIQAEVHRLAAVPCGDRNHEGLRRLICGWPAVDAPAPWMGQDVAMLAFVVLGHRARIAELEAGIRAQGRCVSFTADGKALSDVSKPVTLAHAIERSAAILRKLALVRR